MTIPRKTWIIFSILSVLSIAVWYKYTYPQLAFIDLSVDRPAAIKLAQKYIMDEHQVSEAQLAQYRNAAVFVALNAADQYLQRTLGHRQELQFFQQHDYQLFFWSVRFFKVNEKEEFLVKVSAADGQITGANHTIDETASRPDQTQDEAKQKAIRFLSDRFGFSADLYEPHTDHVQKYDQRTDYYFSWKKRGVAVPWSENEVRDGSAKLLTGVTVSGDEILNFFKISLDIPDQYHRHMDRMQNIGRNIMVVFRIIFYILLTASIFQVVVRRNSLVMHSVKHFAVGLTLFIYLLLVASYFNDFEHVLYSYPTTVPMGSFLWRSMMGMTLDTFIAVLSILMPCLAGEALYYEVTQGRKDQSFLHYLRTSFLSRQAAAVVALGYLAALIMIGIQSLAFEVGQRYLGVWIEYSWMTQFSASFWPFLAAFTLGVVASFSEEISFRLFSVSLGKKFFKNTALACLLASVIWGYAHSDYMVFPMWFRGLEVTLMGLFLCYVYLRFGLLTTITAHYLFDVFWGASAHLLGKSSPALFLSSIAMLLLPLAFVILAWLIDRKVAERPLRWKLSRHQLYNLAILKEYLQKDDLWTKRPADEIKNEIASHGWDIAVVEAAIEDLKKAAPTPVVR